MRPMQALLLLTLSLLLLGISIVASSQQVVLNVSDTYAFNNSFASIWGNTVAPSDSYSFNASYASIWGNTWRGANEYVFNASYASIWENIYRGIEVYSFNATSSIVSRFLYIYWRDQATGIPACFPFRACVVDFALPVQSNVTISVDNESFFFNNVNNGVVENSFTFTHYAYTNVTLHVVPDGNESASFNYTIPLVTSTVLSNVSWSYNQALKRIEITGSVFFNGYDIPASNETVELLVNGTVSSSYVTGSDGRFSLAFNIPGQGVYYLCVKALHGNEVCRTYTLKTQGISITLPSGGLPGLNYSFPTLAPKLNATIPSPTKPMGLFVLLAFAALYMISAAKIGWVQAMFPLAIAMIGYGGLAQSNVLLTGGVLLIVGAFLLLKLRGG